MRCVWGLLVVWVLVLPGCGPVPSGSGLGGPGSAPTSEPISGEGGGTGGDAGEGTGGGTGGGTGDGTAEGTGDGTAEGTGDGTADGSGDDTGAGTGDPSPSAMNNIIIGASFGGARLDFGRVRPRRTAEVEVGVTGAGSVTVTAVEVIGGPVFERGRNGCAEFRFPGDCRVVVRATPPDEGEFRGSIAITTSDGETASLSLLVTGGGPALPGSDDAPTPGDDQVATVR